MTTIEKGHLRKSEINTLENQIRRTKNNSTDRVIKRYKILRRFVMCHKEQTKTKKG